MITAVRHRSFLIFLFLFLSSTLCPHLTGAMQYTPTVVEDIFEGEKSSEIRDVISVGDKIFFIARNNEDNFSVWVSDGTTSNTFSIKSFTIDQYVEYMTNVNGTLYFVLRYNLEHSRVAELWSSNGSLLGTSKLIDFHFPLGQEGEIVHSLTGVGDTLYFVAFDLKLPKLDMYDNTHGYELWKSNGTSINTMLVKDIIPGGDSSNPYELTNLNGILFFNASMDGHGAELWKSDGTEVGTVMVKDTAHGPNSGNPAQLKAKDNLLFFTTAYVSGIDEQNYCSLWKSDGTSTGTIEIVKKKYDEYSLCAVSDFTFSGPFVYFIDRGVVG